MKLSRIRTGFISKLVFKSVLVLDFSNWGIISSLVEKKDRSRMTIPFRIVVNNKPDELLEKKFVEEADKRQSLKELKGHRSVGGLRASIFNAVSYEEVSILVDFMKSFMSEHAPKAN